MRARGCGRQGRCCSRWRRDEAMYILLADWSRDDAATGDDTAAMMAAHRRYDAYLEANRHRFPEQAFAFAAAPWHHDFSDHRAPHDAWVQSFRFVDASLPDGGDKRLVDLEIVLLGAYHDGHLHLTYRRVHRYALAGMDVRDGPTEIYRDEVRLSKSKRVLH